MAAAANLKAVKQCSSLPVRHGRLRASFKWRWQEDPKPATSTSAAKSRLLLVGLRHSQIALTLQNYCAQLGRDRSRSVSLKRREHLERWLPKAACRMSSAQLLLALRIGATSRVRPELLHRHIWKELKRMKADALLKKPDVVIAVLDAMQSSKVELPSFSRKVAQAVEARLDTLTASQAARLLSQLVSAFGSGLHGGVSQPSKTSSIAASKQLVGSICEHVGLGSGLAMRKQELGLLSVQETAEVLCALCQLQADLRPPDETISALSSCLENSLDKVHPDLLGHLAVKVSKAMPAEGPLGDESFIFLHALCRRSAEVLPQVPVSAVAALMDVFTRRRVYDEVFVETLTSNLTQIAGRQSGRQIMSMLRSFHVLPLSNKKYLNGLGKALCDRLRMVKTEDFKEADVGSLRLLVPSAHFPQVLRCFIPVVDQNLQHYHTDVLGALIDLYSHPKAFCERSDEAFLHRLLEEASQRTLLKLDSNMDQSDASGSSVDAVSCIAYTEYELTAEDGERMMDFIKTHRSGKNTMKQFLQLR